MTGKELIEQIKALGFDGDADPTDRLYSVITLSMRLLAAQYPKTSSKEIVKSKGSALLITPADIEGCKELAPYPIFKDFLPYSSAIILDGAAIIPRDADGVFTVRYIEDVPAFSDELYDEELCLSPCAQHLLPLLTAGYFWQDDEPEKADVYMRQYAEGARLLRSQRVKSNTIPYQCEGNW